MLEGNVLAFNGIRKLVINKSVLDNLLIA